MKARGWPWWAIFVQTLGGLTFLGIAVAIDYARQDAAMMAAIGPIGAGPSEPFNWAGLASMWPYVLLFLFFVVVIPAFVATLAFVVVGLPIRLIPAVRRWWVAHYVPLIVLAASIVLLIVGWMTIPVNTVSIAPYVPVFPYEPSSPLFVIATALGAFAAWHFWLPARNRGPVPEKSAASSVRVKELDEERRLGRLL